MVIASRKVSLLYQVMGRVPVDRLLIEIEM